MDNNSYLGLAQALSQWILFIMERYTNYFLNWILNFEYDKQIIYT